MGQMIRVGASERDGYNLAAYGAIMIISCVALAVMVLYSIFAGPAFADSAYGFRELREFRVGAADDPEKKEIPSGAFHGAEAQNSAPVSGDPEASEVTDLEPHDTSDSVDRASKGPGSDSVGGGRRRPRALRGAPLTLGGSEEARP